MEQAERSDRDFLPIDSPLPGRLQSGPAVDRDRQSSTLRPRAPGRVAFAPQPAEQDVMRVRDIMSAPVVTIAPDASVSEIAALIVRRNISGIPVVADDSRIVGIVTEADLLHRPEIGTAAADGSFWHGLFTSTEALARAYTKSHGLRAADVMTSPAITIGEEATVAELVRLLETNRIKRVPVVRGGRLVGIVARGDVLNGLINRDRAPHSDPAPDDEAILDQLLASLKQEPWAGMSYAYITVRDRTAHLWGMVETDAQIKALVVAAERTPGITSVANHLSKVQPFMYWGE